MTTEEFVTKSIARYGNRYDYSEAVYRGYFKPICLICKTCRNRLTPTPSNHFLYSSCKFCCAQKQSKPFDKFLEQARQIHGDKYEYDQNSYVNARTKIRIFCMKCAKPFWQLPRVHVSQGSGCPMCRHSQGERAICKALDANNISYLREHEFPDCRNQHLLPFDFYLPDKTTCIEFDGKQHFDKTSRFYSERLVENDKIKTDYCKSQNIRLVRIPHWRIDEIPDIIASLLP